MNYNELNFQGLQTERQWDISEAFPVLMRKVYVWMTLALAITGFTAYGVATSPGILQVIYGNQVIMWILVIAELALVFGVNAAINRISLTTATLMFILYSVINGALLSSIFLIYTASSIAISSMGKILFMALIGLVIATVVNMFIKSNGFMMILSYVGVLIFVGLTAYDTQRIKNMLLEAPDASEGAQKVALLGALALYLDFINLFIYLLRIFGRRE